MAKLIHDGMIEKTDNGIEINAKWISVESFKKHAAENVEYYKSMGVKCWYESHDYIG